jgi:hypothetical protein
LIRERTVAGSKPANALGRKEGRSARLSAKEINTVRALLKTAHIPVGEIAARFAIARSTLYRTDRRLNLSMRAMTCSNWQKKPGRPLGHRDTLPDGTMEKLKILSGIFIKHFFLFVSFLTLKDP